METIERRDTPRGELVLRRDEQTDRYEIISNGTFLMDTSDGRSERLLVTEALASTGVDLMLDPAFVERAWEEFRTSGPDVVA